MLKARNNFGETTPFNTYYHLNWQAVSDKLKFDRLVPNPYHKYLVNHFEGHREISSKFKLLKNLENICRQKQIFLFDVTPITFVIDYESPSLTNDFDSFISYYLNKSANQQLDMVSLELLKRKNFYAEKGLDPSKNFPFQKMPQSPY